MWAAKYVTSAVVGEKIPEEVKGKTFYDLKAPLPGSKGSYDFVSTEAELPPTLLYLWWRDVHGIV
jgi:hypothetical protein